MKKLVPVLLALTLCLSACAPQSPPEAHTTPPAEEAPTLLSLLRELPEEAMDNTMWNGRKLETFSSQVWLPALRAAADSPLERGMLAEEALWGIEVSIRAFGNSPGGTLHLYAGPEENVVEAFGRDGLPEDIVFLENQALYQLIRTSRDQEGILNDSFYEEYRDLVDGYFDSRLEGLKDQGYVGWELSEFIGAVGSTKEQGKGVVGFQMKAAYYTDPPELALELLREDAWVDSRLYVHNLDEQAYVVTLDGEPLGVAVGDDVADCIADLWGKEIDPAQVKAMVEVHAPQF